MQKRTFTTLVEHTIPPENSRILHKNFHGLLANFPTNAWQSLQFFRKLNFNKWDEYSINWTLTSSTCKLLSVAQDRWYEILNIVSPTITFRWRHRNEYFSHLNFGTRENYYKAFSTKSVPTYNGIIFKFSVFIELILKISYIVRNPLAMQNWD